MVASTDIRYYVHTNQKAPQLENAFGSMLNVLDACLVNGFGSQTVESLTADDTTVTADFGKAHNFLQYQVIKIEGAVQEEFNGEHRIISVTTNTISFDIAQPASTSRASGLISCSLPPLGWEKPFASQNPSGGGKGAYRSKNTLLPSRPFLRVVDELDPLYNADWAKYAKVGIVEDMLDIDTMLGEQAPFDSSNPDKNWVATGSGASVINGWAKWYYSTDFIANSYYCRENRIPRNIAKQWLIVGGDDFFYIFNQTNEKDFNLLVPYGFFRLQGNYFNQWVLASYIQPANVNTGVLSYFGLTTSNKNIVNYLLLSKKPNYNDSNTCFCTSLDGSNNSATGYKNMIPAPSNLIPIVSYNVSVVDGSSIPRGYLPSIEHLAQQLPYQHMQLIKSNTEIKLAVRCAAEHSASNFGMLLFNLGEI